MSAPAPAPAPGPGPAATPTPTPARTPALELDRQVEAYLTLGVPALHGLDPAGFLERVTALRQVLPDPAAAPEQPGRLSFVLVVPGVPAEALMPLTRQGGHAGYVDMNPVGSEVFAPVAEARPPGTPYLAIDVDTGAKTLGVTPLDAGEQLAAAGRLPLTIDEGIAALLLHPDLLRTANCYQLLASRDASKRIPSLWVTGKGRPRLGWCYEGMPHSWLGAASCAQRRTA